ncbi:hypothetical protein GGR42_001639 [Saonia flava]|uniref:DUF4301 domain-containing protein n=1 Tax=Saonia flava TaxID=523696 RepID=A0A846QVC6_9FLAO|nr:DUF4301 family protein [Saonia flava]NJB71177.1 hypothetical protein [Saonia flava]
MNFNEKDLKQLASKGISKEKVVEQVETFKKGIPFVRLEKAAIISDGILKLSDAEEKNLIEKFDESISGLSLLKFVPASGAASRMFKALFNFLDTYNPSSESLEAYLERTGDKNMKIFFDGYQNFAFYDLIQNSIKGKATSKDEEKYLFVKQMMLEEGFNYGFFPKGLLPFHDYGNYAATPFEEHLNEASAYAKADGTANLHFTISEQHGKMFNEEFNKVGERVSQKTKTSFNVGYSFQKPSTDTIAVDMENNLFRNSDGSLLFRPGGHGALIENLDEQNADVIFIKNIDNVVVPKFAENVGNSKKVLAGLLLQVQGMAFDYAALLDMVEITAEQLNEIKDFLETKLNVRFSGKFNSFSIGEQIKILKDKINRPIRVCGMVKNEGEPGGGPFWINDGQGNISLQIIESAQVNMDNESQVEILKGSTHFNPVDLVCAVKNYKGEKYNLLNFVDHRQGFITEKTKEGKNLKAMELPGLWNGAMAFWNTIFVEVPLITFNPVKTVNDLLKPAHQNK